MKKQWVLLAGHRPEKDPRLGWIRDAAPNDLNINIIAVDHEVNDIRFKQNKKNIEIVFPYHLNSWREDWISDLCINNKDGIATKIYLWLKYFKKENRDSIVHTLSKNVSNKRAAHLYNIFSYYHGITTRLVSSTICCEGIIGIIAADFETLLAAAILKELLNVAVVYDAHEYRSEEDHISEEWEKKLLKDIEISLLTYTDARYIVSDGLRDLATVELKSEFKALPNAIPTVIEYKKDSKEQVKECKFIFLGGMGEGRGLEKLINNWVNTPDECLLYLQGPESNYKENLKVLAEQNGVLGSKVFILKSASEDELLDSLKGFDVGVIPYEPVCINNKFCCPNKLSQYMASGLAILANDLNSVKETIRKAECGISVDFNDSLSFRNAITKLTTCKENLEKLKTNARKYHLSHYNWEEQSKEFYETIKIIGSSENSSRLLFNHTVFLNLNESIKKMPVLSSYSNVWEALFTYIIASLIISYKIIIPKKVRNILYFSGIKAVRILDKGE